MIYKNPKNGLVVEFDEYMTFGDLLCEQCGKQIDTDTHYCPECREYVCGYFECPDCNGVGELEVGLKESFASQRIDQRFQRIKCERCNGEGKIY